MNKNETKYFLSVKFDVDMLSNVGNNQADDSLIFLSDTNV